MIQIAKIELKITKNQLAETCSVLDFDTPLVYQDRERTQRMKSYYSLLNVVRLKLAKKLLSSSFKAKPFKLSMEFYEANCLHKTMKALKLNQDAQNLFNQLDQKLA